MNKSSPLGDTTASLSSSTTSTRDVEELRAQPTRRYRMQICTLLFMCTILLPFCAFTAIHQHNYDTIVVLFLSLTIFSSSLVCMLEASPIPQRPYDIKRQTWFGHHMSDEGEWKHLPIVVCAVYAFVLLFGAIVSLITRCHVLTIPMFYLVGLFVFYLWHAAAHMLESSKLHEIHMHHHQAQYPRHDFYGDAFYGYRREPATMWDLMKSTDNTTSKLAHDGPLVLAVILIIMIAKFVFDISSLTCIFAFLGYVFMGTYGSAMHMSFHEREFELEQYACYRELRALHMLHHMHRKNYAMVNIVIDIVCCSLMLSE